MLALQASARESETANTNDRAWMLLKETKPCALLKTMWLPRKTGLYPQLLGEDAGTWRWTQMASTI